LHRGADDHLIEEPLQQPMVNDQPKADTKQNQIGFVDSNDNGQKAQLEVEAKNDQKKSRKSVGFSDEPAQIYGEKKGEGDKCACCIIF
jgi:hypothetical protein